MSFDFLPSLSNEDNLDCQSSPAHLNIKYAQLFNPRDPQPFPLFSQNECEDISNHALSSLSGSAMESSDSSIQAPPPAINHFFRSRPLIINEVAPQALATKGCNCAKTKCLKKYCPCFNSQTKRCSKACKCKQCGISRFKKVLYCNIQDVSFLENNQFNEG